MTQTATATQVIAKCRKGHAVTGAWVDVRSGWLPCPCGSEGVAKGVTVTIKETATCGGRCTSSIGPACSCSCGGENHGSDHRYHG